MPKPCINPLRHSPSYWLSSGQMHVPRPEGRPCLRVPQYLNEHTGRHVITGAVMGPQMTHFISQSPKPQPPAQLELRVRLVPHYGDKLFIAQHSGSVRGCKQSQNRPPVWSPDSQTPGFCKSKPQEHCWGVPETLLQCSICDHRSSSIACGMQAKKYLETGTQYQASTVPIA